MLKSGLVLKTKKNADDDSETLGSSSSGGRAVTKTTNIILIDSNPAQTSSYNYIELQTVRETGIVAGAKNVYSRHRMYIIIMSAESDQVCKKNIYLITALASQH